MQAVETVSLGALCLGFAFAAGFATGTLADRPAPVYEVRHFTACEVLPPPGFGRNPFLNLKGYYFEVVFQHSRRSAEVA